MQVNAGYRDILKIAIPVMVGSLANNIVMLIDTAFLNRVGETQMAAAGLSSVFYFILVMTAVGLMNGMQIMIGRRAGEGDEQAIGNLFRQGFLLALGVSFFFFLFLTFAGDFISSVILTDHDLNPYYYTFIHARKYGILFGVLNTCLISFFVGISHTRVSYYSTISIAIVNIVLDYILIFGRFGFPVMGVAGAAWATNIAELVGTLILFAYMFYYSFDRRYNLFASMKIDSKAMMSIVKLSLPVVFQYLISISSWFFFFVSIQQLGTHALAISNNLRSVYIFGAIPCWGFGTAANTMVSNLLGQKRPHDVLPLISKATTLNLLFMLAIVLVVIIFKFNILNFYTPNAQTIRDSYLSLYAIVLAMLVASAAVVHLQGVTGTGSTGFALITEIASVFVYVLHVILTVYYFHTDLAVVWLAEALYFTVALVFNYRYLHSKRWEAMRV